MTEESRLLMCDTCGDKYESLWVFAHHAFRSSIPTGFMNFDAGDWGACDPCAALILQRDLEGLVTRAKQYPAVLRIVYADLFANLLNSPTRRWNRDEAEAFWGKIEVPHGSQ